MADLAALQSTLGITFNDSSLLEKSLVHRSYLNENPHQTESNERLEFLGDALIGLAIADELYRRFPERHEGELTKLRSAVVRRESLAEIADLLHLGQYLYLGRGEAQGGGRNRERNLACVFEAVIGAALLDSGYDVARNLVLKLLKEPMEQAVEQMDTMDYKSRLQEVVQAQQQYALGYRVIEMTGPDHDRVFRVEVTVGGIAIGVGSGKSKQQAEKDAARVALEALSREDDAV
jgi:ribonuclease-3